LKFQAVAEKTAKDARGLLYFAAPGRINQITDNSGHQPILNVDLATLL